MKEGNVEAQYYIEKPGTDLVCAPEHRPELPLSCTTRIIVTAADVYSASLCATHGAPFTFIYMR